MEVVVEVGGDELRDGDVRLVGSHVEQWNAVEGRWVRLLRPPGSPSGFPTAFPGAGLVTGGVLGGLVNQWQPTYPQTVTAAIGAAGGQAEIVATAVGVQAWPEPDRGRGLAAARLAVAAYAGTIRDGQLSHPLSVTTVLRTVGVTEPRVLMLALLHELPELRPDLGGAIRDQVGDDIWELLDGYPHLHLPDSAPVSGLPPGDESPGDESGAHRNQRTTPLAELPMNLVTVLVADWLQQLRELLLVPQETRWLRLVGAVVDGWLPEIEPLLNEHATLRALADAFRVESAPRTTLGTWNHPARAPLTGLSGLG